MNLTDEIRALAPSARPSNTCSVCWTLREADDDLRSTVNDALAGGVVVSKLAEILVRNGYDVTSDALRRHHRNGHTL